MGRLMLGAGGASPPTEDEIEVYCAVLRERTRAADAFQRVAAENAGYGFRRNLLGLKPLGIIASALALAIALALLGAQISSGQHHEAFLLVVVALVDPLSMAAWTFVVSPAWVCVQGVQLRRGPLRSGREFGSVLGILRRG